MFQLTVQKKEWDAMLLIAKSVVVLFFGLQFGKTGAAYFSIAALTFYVFYILFGAQMVKEFGRFILRKKLKDENTNLHSHGGKMLAFTLFLGLVGGAALFLLANPLALFLRRTELLMLFRLLAILLPVSVLTALLDEILATEYPMLVYCILSLVELLAFIGSYLLINMKLEHLGVLLQALLHTELVSAYYGVLAILLAFLVVKVIMGSVLFLLFLKSNNKKSAGELIDNRKKEAFTPTKFYIRGVPEVFFQLQFCFMAMLFTGRYLSKAEDTTVAIANIGKLYGCVMVVAVGIPFIVKLLTVCLQQKAILAVTREERKAARKSISVCVQFLWIFSIMPALSILVLKEPIISLLGESFLDSELLLVKTAFLSIPVLIFVFCTKLWNELQPLVILCITLVGNILFSLFLWFQMDKNTSKVLLYVGCYLVAMAILFLVLTIREYGIHTEILSKMLFASVFAAVLSLFMLGMKILLSPHLGVKITMYLSLAVGFFLYWILLFTFHIVNDKDQKALPIVRLFKKEKSAK